MKAPTSKIFLFGTVSTLILVGAGMGCVHKETSRDPASRELASYADGGAGIHDIEPVQYLEQNWTPAERQGFYHTPQGSHILPLKFALALEAKNSDKPFFSSEHLARYGYIPQKPDQETNPYGLPVGFTVDGLTGYSVKGSHSTGPKQLGMNCAACHTSEIRYGGTAIRIDGGQGFTDFQRFVTEMDEALIATSREPARLERFLAKVQADSENHSDAAALRAEFDQVLESRRKWQGFNHSDFSYGPGRNDAFGVIFNQVLANDLGIASNASEPDAPVSYPVIWDGPMHDFVQWNGLANNSVDNGGPLARNVGQVLGVFGHIDLQRTSHLLDGYCSTARRYGLEMLEQWLGKLTSPKWPEATLGQIVQSKAERGQAIYRNKCIACHEVIQSTDPNRHITAKLIPMSRVGTDPKFNERALSREADTGPLKGRLTRLREGRPLEAREPGVTVLRHAVAGALAGSISLITCSDSMDTPTSTVLKRWAKVGKKILAHKEDVQLDDDPNPEVRKKRLLEKLSVYKARPLNGVWSSAPYLHNGSVKSLAEMLTPPDKRSQSFYTGCGKFDPVHVGVDCDSSNGQLYDARLGGNRPMGHPFGTKLKDDEREDLIEYLKTL
jgi:mono/diheme cytochrome c family protein